MRALKTPNAMPGTNSFGGNHLGGLEKAMHMRQYGKNPKGPASANPAVDAEEKMRATLAANPASATAAKCHRNGINFSRSCRSRDIEA